jgi:phytoene dehydrogenase-like protein
MTDSYDTIVVGAGHNSLTTAAYLAKAGEKLLVLEKNSWIGGGVVTHELTEPGFLHDRHSTAHVFIQGNPMITQDELGLISDFGLKYIYPDISFATIFDDHTSLITYQDVDRTCKSIAQFSEKDADSYRKFTEMSKQILPLLTSSLYVPPAPQGTFFAMLDQSPEGRDIMAAMQKSVYDLVTEWFEHEKVIIHLLKFTSEALAAPEEKGPGITLYLMPGFVHTYPCGLPEGGSGELSNALVRCIEHYGGIVKTDQNVVKIIQEGGKAVGVRLESGEEYRAKNAVVGSIHPHLLDQYVSGLEDRIIKNAKGIQPASFSAMNTHYALNEAPLFHAGQEAAQALLLELVPSRLDDFRRTFDNYRYGMTADATSIVAAIHTNHDPSRAPLDKATLYMYSFMPFALKEGGSAMWDEVKEKVADKLLADFRKYSYNMTSDNIIARYVDSPLDMLRSSDSFQDGDVHGTGPFLYQFGGHRPTPELSQFAVPGVENFYLAGPFMHPGGGVFGGGRATAIKILDDFGKDFDDVVNG